MQTNNCWMDRWRHIHLLWLFTPESTWEFSPPPLSCLSLPLISSQTLLDTWPFSAMETTQTCCVSALAFHATPFQSLSPIVTGWFYQNSNLIISVLRPDSSMLPPFPRVVEMSWVYFPNRPQPTAAIHSGLHQHTPAISSQIPNPHGSVPPSRLWTGGYLSLKSPLSLTQPSAPSPLLHLF